MVGNVAFRVLDGAPFRLYFGDMNKLAEIEAAAAALSPKQQRKLLEHLTSRLAGAEVKGLSAHELMKDGCGMVKSGKGDLSANKKHLRGYGR